MSESEFFLNWYLNRSPSILRRESDSTQHSLLLTQLKITDRSSFFVQVTLPDTYYLRIITFLFPANRDLRHETTESFRFYGHLRFAKNISHTHTHNHFLSGYVGMPLCTRTYNTYIHKS